MGWVIYRTSYRAEFDPYWAQFRDAVDAPAARRAIASSEAPDPLDKRSGKIVEDPALDGASPWDLQSRFLSWAEESEYNLVVSSIGNEKYSPPIYSCLFAGLSFKRMGASMVAPYFYEAVQTDEQWYVLLPFPPPHVNGW